MNPDSESSIDVHKFKTIFEKSNNCPLNHHRIPKNNISDGPISKIIPSELLETDHGYACDEDLILPEVSEIELVRHYIELSKRNFGVDNGFYPLGSCTMKYNPKICEAASSFEGFLNIHPTQQEVSGALELIYELEHMLSEITGMDSFTCQPAAGAHGEFTGIAIMKQYFKDRNEKKKLIIIPDSAHGTNPASSAMCGYGVIVLDSNSKGQVDLDRLEIAMKTGDVAGIMLTNPNTLGIFEENILDITEIVHKYGGLCYYDGANMNAMLGKCKPGQMGFDIIHLNLHKTFSTPHGGGGPGSGPVGVKAHLSQYLPNPRIYRDNDNYYLTESQRSIGKIKNFYGNFLVLVRAYTYIKIMGADGLKRASENAVLNANYLRTDLKEIFNLPYDQLCKHEFVLNDAGLPNHITTMDIAKRLLDYNTHAPTIYFPLIVEGAMMIEPTETESKQSLDKFIEIMNKIRSECEESPEALKTAPNSTVVGRLDEVKAARKLDIKWQQNL